MDPAELGRLLDRHARVLELYARQWCHQPEDIVQEAFVNLARQAPQPTQVVSWLYRAVRNGALNAARDAKCRRDHEAEASRRAAWFALDSAAELDAQTATEALSHLPLEQREVIVAHVWGGLSFAEIGELIEASASTAHRWYLAGLTTLRERLGVTCPPPK
jgi:RNA polymerase sigma-70 factor (ECF subfamily)